MHTEDCGRAFASLLDSSVSGPVNIASGIPASLGEVAREIAAQCHAENLLDLADQPCSAQIPAYLVADVYRLESEVGFVPRFDLCKGIRQVLARSGSGASLLHTSPGPDPACPDGVLD
jgi:nucleoside-diphosphate-sugar epimerase